MRNETSRDVTCACTYEAVGIEDGLARPVLLNADSERPKAAWRAKRNGATNSRETATYPIDGRRSCPDGYDLHVLVGDP